MAEQVSGFVCRCHGQPTRTEVVMAEKLGVDVNEVHAFMCTWERIADHVLDGIEEGTIPPMQLIVYVILSGGGLESVWFTPEEAIDALDKIKGRSTNAYITVRPVGYLADTPESEAARDRLRLLERNHHNAKAKAMREAVRKPTD